MSGTDLVHRYIDAVNQGDVGGLAALYAPDAVMYVPLAPEGVKGRDAIVATFAAIKGAIPDMRWRLLSPVINDGTRLAFEAELAGVHSGPIPTPGGDLPPTNNAVSVSMALVETLDVEGRIAEERAYFDATGFAAQLGITG